MKKQAREMQVIKQSAIINQKLFIDLVDNYEKINLSAYVEEKNDKMVFGDVRNADIKA